MQPQPAFLLGIRIGVLVDKPNLKIVLARWQLAFELGPLFGLCPGGHLKGTEHLVSETHFEACVFVSGLLGADFEAHPVGSGVAEFDRRASEAVGGKPGASGIQTVAARSVVEVFAAKSQHRYLVQVRRKLSAKELRLHRSQRTAHFHEAERSQSFLGLALSDRRFHAQRELMFTRRELDQRVRRRNRPRLAVELSVWTQHRQSLIVAPKFDAQQLILVLLGRGCLDQHLIAALHRHVDRGADHVGGGMQHQSPVGLLRASFKNADVLGSQFHSHSRRRSQPHHLSGHFAGGGQILFQVKRRETQHLRDVIETVARVIGGKSIGGPRIDREDVANDIIVLFSVQPPEGRPSLPSPVAG